MSDSTYQPKVYRAQGGNQLVVASTGNITIESGGGVDYSSGAQLRMAAGSLLTVPVVAATTAAAMANSGVSVITGPTTATGANNYSMDAPVAGCVKYLFATAANSSDHIIITGNTNVTYDGGVGTKTKLKIILPGLVTLIGLSTSAWGVSGSTLQVTPTS